MLCSPWRSPGTLLSTSALVQLVSYKFTFPIIKTNLLNWHCLISVCVSMAKATESSNTPATCVTLFRLRRSVCTPRDRRVAFSLPVSIERPGQICGRSPHTSAMCPRLFAVHQTIGRHRRLGQRTCFEFKIKS